jgi:PAS domain S-box-containing protein
MMGLLQEIFLKRETMMNESTSVLIVDDSRAARLYLREIIQTRGYRVFEAANGREGLELLDRENPDLILTDMEMPEMDGLAFIRELRNTCPHIPVIVISGKSSYSDVIEAVRLGAWDYLVKPVRVEDLNIIISRSLERARLLDENCRYRRQLEEQVQAQTQELLESSERYRRLLKSVTSYVYTVTFSGERSAETVHRPGCEKVTGYTIEEFLAVPDLWYKIVHEDDQPKVLAMSQNILTETAILESEHRILHKDGSTRWVRDTLVPCRDKAGVIISYDGIISEITERKVAQEKLKSHMDNLTALRNIDKAINGSLDLRIILKLLLMEALKSLNVDAAVVLLLNPFSQTLEFASGQGFHTDLINFARVRMGESCAGRVAKERSTLFQSDIASAQEGSAPKTLVESEGFKSYVGVPLIAKGKVKGVLELFHRAPLNPEPDWLNFVEALAGQAAIAIDNAELFENLQSSNSELLSAYDTTIEGWSRALDYRDKETEGHSRRVTDLTVRVAREVGIGNEKLVHIRRGALLHDIGKLGVPDNILLKPGKLTHEEFEIMKKHPEIAFSLLSPIEFLRPALDIPHFHHEKWDGSGYPQGLKGEEIPLYARIFAVADVWDALCSDRPYRAAWAEARVMEYMNEQSGKDFDPSIVELFLSMVSKSQGCLTVLEQDRWGVSQGQIAIGGNSPEAESQFPAFGCG